MSQSRRFLPSPGRAPCAAAVPARRLAQVVPERGLFPGAAPAGEVAALPPTARAGAAPGAPGPHWPSRGGSVLWQGRGHAGDGSAGCHVPLGSHPSGTFAKRCLQRDPERVLAAVGDTGVPVTPGTRRCPASAGLCRGCQGGLPPGVWRRPGGAVPSCRPPNSRRDPDSVAGSRRGAGTQDEPAVAMTTGSHRRQRPGAPAAVFPLQKLPWHSGRGGWRWHRRRDWGGSCRCSVAPRFARLCPRARRLCREVVSSCQRSAGAGPVPVPCLGACSGPGTLKPSGVSPVL